MGSELTIPLDADVAEQLEEARRAGNAVEKAVNEAATEAANDAARRVLKEMTPITPKPFVVHARDLGAVPDVNFDCAWKLLHELDGADTK